MRAYFLASSSKANCTVLEHEGAAILIDAGLPLRSRKSRSLLGCLGDVGVDPKSLLGAFISHHHGDHAGKAGELSAGLHFPLYMTAETLEASPPSLLAKAEEIERVLVPGQAVSLGPFAIEPVATYHVPGAVGFRVCAGERCASIFTDVAELSGAVAEAFEKSHLIGVESDFSEPMLAACGDYDSDLKQRIRLTHTSNERLAEFFSNGFGGDCLKTVVLLHLSLVANWPFLAENQVRTSLRGREVTVTAAPPDSTFGPVEV